jgi:ubiquinone/menaquinone biosynthesis C-methylase UbiE
VAPWRHQTLVFSQDGYLRFVKTILRFFFKLLYHQFAFAYDFVAATVSVGQWKNWIASILPFIEGTRILEIGHGPGHLQRILLSRGLDSVAIDESAPMGLLAKRNTNGKATLARALAQGLPFADASFDIVVATFPAEYITDLETLLEVKRCLSDGGRFIVLPVALQMGRKPLDRVMSFLFRITRQSPVDPLEEVKKKLRAPFVEAGFEVEIKELQLKSSLLLVVLASSPSEE